MCTTKTETVTERGSRPKRRERIQPCKARQSVAKRVAGFKRPVRREANWSTRANIHIMAPPRHPLSNEACTFSVSLTSSDRGRQKRQSEQKLRKQCFEAKEETERKRGKKPRNGQDGGKRNVKNKSKSSTRDEDMTEACERFNPPREKGTGMVNNRTRATPSHGLPRPAKARHPYTEALSLSLSPPSTHRRSSHTRIHRHGGASHQKGGRGKKLKRQVHAGTSCVQAGPFLAPAEACRAALGCAFPRWMTTLRGLRGHLAAQGSSSEETDV